MNCPICNFPSTLMNTVLRYGEGEVYYCNNCAVGFLKDDRSQEELDQYYANEYRTHHGSNDANAIFNADRLKFQNRRFDRYAEFILGYYREPVRILEIGSSSGQFMHLFRNVYGGDMSAFELWGVEPDPICRTYCQHKVPTANLVANISELPKDKKFDSIILFQVFEHVKDIKQFIEKLKSLMYSGSGLVIEVPSLYDVLLSGYDIPDYKKVFYHKAHLWYFTPKGLKKFLTDNGFSGSITYIQDYDLMNHMKWLTTGNTPKELTSNWLLKQWWEEMNDSYMAHLEKTGISSNVTFMGELK